MHKRQLNQTKSRHTDEGNNTPVDVAPMKVFPDTFDVSIAGKAPEAKILKRQRGKEGIQRESTQKGQDIASAQSKSKIRGVIYTTGEHYWVCPIHHKYVGHYWEENNFAD